MYHIYSNQSIAHKTDNYKEAVEYAQNLCLQTKKPVSILNEIDKDEYDEVYVISYNTINGTLVEVAY